MSGTKEDSIVDKDVDKLFKTQPTIKKGIIIKARKKDPIEEFVQEK